MAKPTSFHYDAESGVVTSYNGKRNAKNAAAALEAAGNETTVIITRAEDLEQLTMAQLVDLYNAAQESEEETVGRFPSKAKGIEAVFPVLSKIAEDGGTVEAPEKPKAKKASKGGGKRTDYDAKRITRKIAENPRREGTHGYVAWECITDGMTVAEFREKCGKAFEGREGNPGSPFKHLMHDVKAGRVELHD